MLIAGSLSHSHTKEAPAGFSEHAKKIDSKIRKILEKQTYKSLNQIPTDIREEVHETLISPLVILSRIIHDINSNFHELSYEHPFGVGYLTGYFTFNKNGS